MVSVFVEQTSELVRVKFAAEIAVTDSLSENANEVPVALLLAFKYELASFVQVRTGAMLSAIVTLVVADAVAMVPEIPF